jgi:acyl carrier protein
MSTASFLALESGLPVQVEERVPRGSDAWLRALVADRLGVAEAHLALHVSLRDDLALDSLDFADLAAAMEAELCIAVPPTLLRQVRTYGDLLELAQVLARERARRAREGVALVRTRLWSPGGTAAAIERVFWLDPYAIEILLEDALHAQPGASLEVVVDAATSATILARVRGRLTRLQRRGIAVQVRRAP